MVLLKANSQEPYVVELRFFDFSSRILEDVIEVEKTFNQYKFPTSREKYLIKTKDNLFSVFADTVEDISWHIQ